MKNNDVVFRFYNRNNKGELIEDCVCRAISTATTLNYDAVQNLLIITSKLYNCPRLCVCCYHNLLEKILNYKNINCNYTKTVAEVARQYYNKKLIIRTNGHLTCSIHGTINDTWDCSQELADCFWTVE